MSVKRWLDRHVAPYRWVRDAYYARRQAARRRDLERLAQVIAARTGLVVPAGPFAGLQYVEAIVRSPYLEGAQLPRLLGVYERELHASIEAVVGRGCSRVVDVGCSEGYYAVGLARRLPDATIHAFDLEADARASCAVLAIANGVAPRVRIGERCDHRTLQALAGPGALVFMDCEGCELDLLDPTRVPALVASDILVELHDVYNPGLTEAVLARFASTHRIERIARQPPQPVPLEGSSPGDAAKAVEEWRGGAAISWALLTPAAEAGGGTSR